jgi:hypothetical protein
MMAKGECEVKGVRIGLVVLVAGVLFRLVVPDRPAEPRRQGRFGTPAGDVFGEGPHLQDDEDQGRGDERKQVEL